MADSIRKQCGKRWEALKAERSSWMPHWQEISEVLIPRAGRFLVTDNNRGDKRHRAILDNSGTRALRTLSGGMMAGMTSPARPWFRLTTKDPQLDESYEVKKWMSKVTSLRQMVFNQSNTYRALQMAYEELGAFGTSATIVLDDYDSIIHCMPLTIGEFALATDSRGNVNTCYRNVRMTVAALVQEFGYENCSPQTKRLYDRGNYDEWIEVVNAIEPRNHRDLYRRDAKNMPYRSVYFEAGGKGDKLLRESGFRQFPVLAARWNVTGGDIYGTGPGMEALGDLKQLQQEQFYKDQLAALTNYMFELRWDFVTQLSTAECKKHLGEIVRFAVDAFDSNYDGELTIKLLGIAPPETDSIDLLDYLESVSVFNDQPEKALLSLAYSAADDGSNLPTLKCQFGERG